MKSFEIHDSEDHITDAAVGSSPAKLLPPDSVLVVVRSGILEHTLPVARTRVGVSVNQDIKGVTPAKGIDAGYLALALRAAGTSILNACSKSGTTVASIEMPALLACEVPIAPPSEQHRIVNEVEQQFTRLDAAVAALERVRANLKRYRASVLKAACEGRLVPTEAELARREGRSFESGGELLKRVIGEPCSRAEPRPITSRRRETNSSPGLQASSDVERTGTQPDGWAVAPLRAVADLKGGITKGQKRHAGVRLRAVPYLRVANVQRGYLDLTEVKEIEATPEEVEDLRLRAGDILFNEGGDRDKLGRGWVWSGQLPLCIHQNHVFRARLVGGVLIPKFVSWFGNSIGQRYFLEQGKQTTNLASINLTKLGQLPVPLPPLAEQHRIVAEVERRLSVVDELEATVEKNLARCARLRQSILKMAFEGQLVPQDPNDEPASVLLERIRREREAEGRTAKSGRKANR